MILTNKDEWVVYPDEIAKRMNVNRATIDKHIKKMVSAGYAQVSKRSLGYGKGFEMTRKFSDRKIFSDLKNSDLKNSNLKSY